ncbi:DUF342 domain-containing protein [Bowmanella sp. JS7-9]|uniref:DUF342 domain-containing protein n=1 Tax=Pseudobowmanella zhangzhouensis TaxID=1537679 RepID=A0ABW1XM11_9ALTE|nr:FapA family protein [Bowmanella sp. JS7-9]TBX23131.1 hypothetical protein TK45_07940 [Bowmanella sp. JS7-9]
MRGVYLNYDSSANQLKLVIRPQEVDVKELNEAALVSHVRKTYGQLYLFEDQIKAACKAAINAQKLQQYNPIEEVAGEPRDSSVRFSVASDKLSATLEYQVGFGGKSYELSDLMDLATQAGIKRGLSRKRLEDVLQRVKTSKAGTEIKDVVAKGLPAKNGRSSKLIPLVPNALDRILRPQSISLSRVDMRDLGEIVCVKPGTELVERRPPGKGRPGYTVTGEVLEPREGEWLPLKPGDGTYVCPHNENLLRAEIAGMPKFQDEKMWVDDVFMSRGVNVGSGNINYDGAVVVNGDVSEKMRIIATGDITINGFVESAHLESGGDIIITQGAMGKHDEDSDTEYSGKLIAQGNVHIQHGQGLDIQCNGNVTVGKQLAYSRIRCGGDVIVGPLENPNGNLFACEIQCEGIVHSGSLGAVSGSHLFVDFSAGLNAILERIDSVDELKKLLRDHIQRHSKKMEQFRDRQIPADLQHRMTELVGRYRDERTMFQQVLVTLEHLNKSKTRYLNDIGLKAMKQLYPGVVVKLNNRTWKADREYSTGHVHYVGHQWQYDPIL